jgi:hypothetical protein
VLEGNALHVRMERVGVHVKSDPLLKKKGTVIDSWCKDGEEH